MKAISKNSVVYLAYIYLINYLPVVTTKRQFFTSARRKTYYEAFKPHTGNHPMQSQVIEKNLKSQIQLKQVAAACY